MAVNKSDILNKLANNFPNFLKKDLSKVISVILENIKESLKNNGRTELRDIVMFEAKKYKSKQARNPKTNEIIFVPEKKIIRFKISKKWAKKINEET